MANDNSIFNISPAAPVNAGLNVQYRPVYPEQAAILAQERKASIEDAKLKQQRAKENREVAMKMVADLDGLDPYDTYQLSREWQGIQDSYIQSTAGGQTMTPEREIMINRQWTELQTRTATTKALEKQARTMLADMQEGKPLEGMNQSAALEEIQRRKDEARAQGVLPNYDDLTEVPQLWDGDYVDNEFIERYERGEREYAYRNELQGTDYQVKFNDSDFYERYDDGSLVFAWNNGNREPVLKSYVPDQVLTQLYSNDPKSKKYLNILQMRVDEKKRMGIESSISDELYEVIKNKKGGVTTTELTTKYIPEDKTGPSRDVAAEGSFIANVTRDLASGDPTRMQRAMAKMKTDKMRFQRNADGSLTPVLKKSWVESMNLEEQRRVLAYATGNKSINDYTDEQIRQLIADQFRTAEIPLNNTTGIFPYEIVVQALNEAGIIKNRASFDEAERILGEEFLSGGVVDLSGANMDGGAPAEPIVKTKSGYEPPM